MGAVRKVNLFTFLLILLGLFGVLSLLGIACIRRLNMDISKVYLGSCVQLYSLAETPQPQPPPPPPTPALTWAYTRALLFAKIDDIAV